MCSMDRPHMSAKAEQVRSSQHWIITVCLWEEIINTANMYTELKSQLSQTAVFLFFLSLHPSPTHIHTLRIHQFDCNCLYWLQLSPELHGMNHSSPPSWQAFTPRWSFASERNSAGFVWASSQLWPSNMWTQTGNLCLHESYSPVMFCSLWL